MASDLEKRMKAERADRLVEARRRARYDGPTRVSRETGVNINSYKAYEQGRNGFGLIEAITFAELFNVSLMWLMFGQGAPEDVDPHIPRHQLVQQMRQEVTDRVREADDDELARIVAAIREVPHPTEDSLEEHASVER